MVVRSTRCRHQLTGNIAVATRAHAAAEDEGCPCRPSCGTELGQKLYGAAVYSRQVVRLEAEASTPIGIGTPGRAIQNETHAKCFRDCQIRLVVPPEDVTPVLLQEQREGGKAGQSDALVVDERRFQAAVREKKTGVQLGETLTVECHEPFYPAQAQDGPQDGGDGAWDSRLTSGTPAEITRRTGASAGVSPGSAPVRLHSSPHVRIISAMPWRTSTVRSLSSQ